MLDEIEPEKLEFKGAAETDRLSDLEIGEGGGLVAAVERDALDRPAAVELNSPALAADQAGAAASDSTSLLDKLLAALRENPAGVDKQRLVDAATAVDAVDKLLEEVENIADDLDNAQAGALLWSWRAEWLLHLKGSPKRASMAAQVALRYAPSSLEPRLVLEDALFKSEQWTELLESIECRIGDGTIDLAALERATMVALERLEDFERAVSFGEMWAEREPSNLVAWRLAERAAVASCSADTALRIRTAMHPYLEGGERLFSAWNLGLTLLDDFDRPTEAQSYLESACEGQHRRTARGAAKMLSVNEYSGQGVECDQ